MAPRIVADATLDKTDRTRVQFKTRVMPRIKHDISEIALAQGRPLRAITEEALTDYVRRNATALLRSQ